MAVADDHWQCLRAVEDLVAPARLHFIEDPRNYLRWLESLPNGTILLGNRYPDGDSCTVRDRGSYCPSHKDHDGGLIQCLRQEGVPNDTIGDLQLLVLGVSAHSCVQDLRQILTSNEVG